MEYIEFLEGKVEQLEEKLKQLKANAHAHVPASTVQSYHDLIDDAVSSVFSTNDFGY